MKPLIIAQNIQKSFDTGTLKQNVLDKVSIQIEEGEFVSIMGPSGSGKSTLMFALSGMDEIDDGTIFFGGKELSSYTDNQLADLRRSQMGFVFQQPTLLKNLNLLDNILLPFLKDKSTSKKQLIQRGKLLMKQLGIEELADRTITQVSGGQLQRVGICRALMGNPKIIFGDEPTGALNSSSTQEVMHIFSEIHKQGTSVVLVTHDVNVAAYADRVLFMKDGNIVSEMTLPPIKEKGRLERTKQLKNKMDALGI